MDSTAFLTDVKTKPLYVGFFHGEFDLCPTEDIPRPEWITSMGVHQKKSMVTIPEGISILHMTRPGAYLTLNSSILYYLIHQKGFYTNTLMPLFAVKNAHDLASRHPNTEYVYWDMEKRSDHSMENILTVDAKLSTNGSSDAAKSALDLMKSITQRKVYDTTDKTLFTSGLRYDRGDNIPNLTLSRFDATITGLGLYKFSPDTKRVDRILLDKVLKREPYMPKTDFTVSDILTYINDRGGGRLVLFSCSSLAPDALRTMTRRPEQKEKFDRIQSYIDEVQANYNQKNPVFSPETEEWSQFTEAFPKIQLPDLAFHNAGSLKAHNYKPLNWILFNLLAYGNFYKDMPVQNLAGSLRNTELQKDAPHGWYLQNTGQRLKNGPEEGEGTVSYMCRRTKQGCSVQGGKRNTRKRLQKKRKTYKYRK
jgi:hypothetical protein